MTRHVLVVLSMAVAVTGCRQEEDKAKPAPAPAPAAKAPVPMPVPQAPSVNAAPPAAPPPKGIGPEQLAAADAVGHWFATVTSAAKGSGDDCVAMAAALQAVGSKGRPIVAKAKGMESKLKSNAAAAAWLHDYTSAKMEAGFVDLMVAIDRCQSHPAVKKALKTLAK